ncbi:aldo/keto reductase [Cuneatibacter sp. NSJ-177]|uniref:aldo/keto reductase n=1 Tax=Cuneatibacter sp. NSJ-177 TaxID=2931401 RepID=UPI001FD35940|nr:aldo/keto reductase [Cuneatibacter sp. NSJ-177]MCJ7834827.1 aldo/keto reductase [Cuneatibacter sp. NSJ-177]
MKTEQKTWKLRDGYEIPALGFGNYNSFGEEEENAVGNALEAGYRYIDSASCYQNEAEVGRAVKKSGVPREEIYLLSKLWPSDYEKAEEALQKTLRGLQAEYLDAYLLHWPGTEESRRLNAYEQVLKLKERGWIRSVGVSNFQPDQMEKLKEVFGDYPVLNQMECHPSFQQKEISDYCKARGIQVIDYRPLNRGAYRENPEVIRIAERHGKTISQVVLRWHVEKCQIPIPKSSNRDRIRENSEIFDFALSADEIRIIDEMETGIRAGSDPFTYNG